MAENIIQMLTPDDWARAKQKATVALQQVIAGASPRVFFTWGVSEKKYTVYNNMPTLMINVNGLLFTGWVYVSLNEGADLYEVRLMGEDNKPTKTVTDIYGDQLGMVIDGIVERKSEWSDDEYTAEVNKAYVVRLK